VPREVAPREQAARFLDLLFEGRDGHAILGVQAAGKKAFTEIPAKWPEERERLLDSIEKRAETHDVWVTPCLFDAGKRTKEHAKPCNVVWADDDSSAGNDSRLMIVDSGRNQQVYQRVQEDLSLEELESWNRRLGAALGADKCWDAPHVLRVPGTRNHKPDGGPVRLVQEGERVSVWDLDLPADPGAITAEAKEIEAEGEFDDFDPFVKFVVLADKPNGDRSAQTHEMVRYLSRDERLSDGQVLTAMRHHAPTVDRGKNIEIDVARILAKVDAETQADEEFRLDWSFRDLVELGSRPVVPPDIAGLFYTEQRHIVSGLSDAGKTMLSIWVAAEEMRAGWQVAWVNTDDMPANELLERLRLFGCTDDQVREQFKYVTPDVRATDAELRRLEHCRLVVYDSINSTMQVEGLDTWRDAEAFYRRLMSPFQRRGWATVTIDHPAKNAQDAAYSYGDQRKHTGTNVHLRVIQAGDGLLRDVGGRSHIEVKKDRTGFLKTSVGGFEMTVVGGIANISLTPPVDKDELRERSLNELDERVLAFVHEYGADGSYPSTNAVRKNVTGKDELIIESLKRLESQGVVRRHKQGSGWAFEAIDHTKEVEG
jgi:hypothetical protein